MSTTSSLSDYGGYVAIGYNSAKVSTPPTSFADLLKAGVQERSRDQRQGLVIIIAVAMGCYVILQRRAARWLQ